MLLAELNSRWSHAAGGRHPNQFFPIFIDEETKVIVDIGFPLDSLDVDRESVAAPKGTVAVWPIRSDGSEGRWRVGRDSLVGLHEQGYLRLGRRNRKRGTWSVNYVLRSDIARIESGEIVVTGRAPEGHAILERVAATDTRTLPKTVWNREAHNAGNHGTALLRTLLPGRAFPFPKSLYAVEDALRFFLSDKPSAVILDFFAGSGTTAHAVMRLNKQDGGRRQCISVTNNEVAADEESSLRGDGNRPGDPDWEKRGICDFITKPRIAAAITGVTPDGEPIKGDYKFTDEFAMANGLEENAEFFTLTYEGPLHVASHREFERIAPLLWLRAGSEGRRIDDVSSGWDVADVYGVIADLDQAEDFLKTIAANDRVAMAFIVTDEDRLFEAMVAELPDHVEPVRLYEAYLRNFEIEAGRGTR